MTSNDRHANHDSPHRSFSGTHQPLPGGGVGRNPPLHSVISSGSQSNLNLSYSDEDNRSTTALHTDGYSQRTPADGVPATGAYTPGSRSASVANGATDPGASGIALQDFGADGMPPAPPVVHSWGRIDKWAEENFPELMDQLCTPASTNDLNELEYSMDCTLPMDVRESLMIHDGQERGGRPTGLIFGAMLMDCEEIYDEWKNWRVVEQEYMSSPSDKKAVACDEAGPSNVQAHAPLGRRDLQARQDCQPEDSVQKVYAHPGWIPVVRDWGGNYIAVDLAPGPKGTWGQVILFGRDYDCKFVVSKSWSHFLAMVADDMQSPHWHVDEDSQELKLKDPKAPRSEPSYMEILRVRNERKFGRRRILRPGSKPGSAPGSPHLNGSAPRGGLTRPQKAPDNMDNNHLKPPKKSSKPLRSVTEESAAKDPKKDSDKDVSNSNLLDEPLDVKTVTELSPNDEKFNLKRHSSDLILHAPPSEEKTGL
jgi:cell wall assembly regulator SMI1